MDNLVEEQFVIEKTFYRLIDYKIEVIYLFYKVYILYISSYLIHQILKYKNIL